MPVRPWPAPTAWTHQSGVHREEPAEAVILSTRDSTEYRQADDIIQSAHPEVVTLAAQIRARHPCDVDFARAAFVWVRDNIAHAADAQDTRITLSSSEVLHERVGLCYAKSHLLAALLRSQRVPTGLCYLRLCTSEGRHVLHGLVTVYLNGRWHRQDPRGNRPGVDTQFSLEKEQLAWCVSPELGECAVCACTEVPARPAGPPGVVALDPPTRA